MDCRFYGALVLRKGDIVRILRGMDGSPLRVTTIQNQTTGETTKSYIEDVVAAFPPTTFAEPIIGRVISSRAGERQTDFAIEPGTIEDHVFVRPGEKQKGQDAIIDIFKNRLDTYVKIWDPYISPDTIKLTSWIPDSIDILILTDNIANEPQVKTEALTLKNRLVIKKGQGQHDRFVLTKGEGWHAGHSLKDFGTKHSRISKMPSSVDEEKAFDESWNLSVSLLDKKHA
jgi:hypothetical protein